jgi:hypothetical protein
MRDRKPSTAGRRAMLAGTGIAGALGAVATLLPKGELQDAPPSQAGPPAEGAAGYRLSEHVKRYYQTTRI